MPELPESETRGRRLVGLLLISAALSAAAVFFLWRAHPDPEYWMQWLLEVRAYLEAHPFALILLLATLPGLGLPVSPVLILFGVVLGPRYGIAVTCLIAVAAQTFCSVWTYALAAGPLHKFLKNSLLRRWTPPVLTDRNALRLGFIVRITPGIPYAVQNIALGVIGLRFKPYLITSIPVTSLYTIGFVVTGGAVFQGKAGLALTGAVLLAVVVLATRMLRSRTTTPHAG